MSIGTRGGGWWVASDGNWYPPHLHPDAQADVASAADEPRFVEADAEVPDLAEAPAPGWWIASDGRWYSPELHPRTERPADEEGAELLPSAGPDPWLEDADLWLDVVLAAVAPPPLDIELARGNGSKIEPSPILRNAQPRAAGAAPELEAFAPRFPRAVSEPSRADWLPGGPFGVDHDEASETTLGAIWRFWTAPSLGRGGRAAHRPWRTELPASVDQSQGPSRRHRRIKL